MTAKKSDELIAHLQKEHKISPFSTYLREIVYGGTDGIVTTFAIVAGFNGAQGEFNTVGIPLLAVTLFGLANLFADGSSMALGNFLSVRASQDVYRSEREKELAEIRHSKEDEFDETVVILISKGFTKKDAEQLAHIYSKNEDYWVEFMMRDELEMPNPENENPFLTGTSTFIAFITFGFIPLAPYILGIGNDNSFLYSIGLVGVALLLLGLLRYKVTGEDIRRSVFEIVFLGGISSTIAYFVGTLFR